MIIILKASEVFRDGEIDKDLVIQDIDFLRVVIVEGD
jgi:hypothetical protein